MSDFGDFDTDDALDTEPADPEQVARKIHSLRRREGFEGAEWEALDESERGALIQIVVVLFAWLKRQGARP